MDILCPFCAEPYDIDSLHDVAEDHGSFNAAYKVFRTKGCGKAFASWGAGSHCDGTRRTDPALYDIAELLGDDVDGYASMVEDFGL